MPDPRDVAREIVGAEVRLTRLLQNYMRREPYLPIVKDALQKEYAEDWPHLVPRYRMVVTASKKGKQRVDLVERSAVDRLGALEC